MPYSYEDVPRPAKNWPANEQRVCVDAANAALERGASEQDAIFACIGAAEREREKHGGEQMDIFADREALRKAAQGRAGKYGIAFKEGKGNLTPPAGYPTSESEYGDPVNYKYPADASHARAALGYFNHAGQREDGGYSSKEWGIIGTRLARLISRHLKGAYSYKGGRLVSREEASDLAVWVDCFSATRVLASEMVRVLPIMPEGYYRHGAKQPPITASEISTLVGNFRQRGSRGYYLTQVPVTIEHQEVQGRIGTVSEMEAREDGAYAMLSLTEKGRRRLEASEFAYMSPEVRWRTLDIVTGQNIGPTLAGIAVTNYPFFGDRTAMYSQEAQALMSEKMLGPGLEGDVLDHVSALQSLVAALNWRMSDLALMSDSAWHAAPGLGDPLGANRRGLLAALSIAAETLPDLAHQRRLLELVFLTREEQGARYPRSAYAISSDGPETWALRLRAYDGGVLLVDPALVEKAMAAAPPETNEMAWEEIFSACAEAGIDPTNLLGGHHMSADSGNGRPPAEQLADRVATLEGELGQYRQQLDQYVTRLAEREGTIAAQGLEIDRLNEARLRDRFGHDVEQFGHLGAERQAFVDHVLWLYRQDNSEGRTHYEFFMELLRTVNRALGESQGFTERGVTGEEAPPDPMAAVERAVKARADARGVVATPGTEQYNAILDEVLAEQPELYHRYRATLVPR